MPAPRNAMLACVFSYLRSLWCEIASGQIFNMDAIGELANLLMVRMLIIRKRGVTTHLTWPSCILIYVNKLVNMQITAGRRFFANSRNSTNSPTATRLRLCRLVRRALFVHFIVERGLHLG